MKACRKTLEKADEEQKEFKLHLSEIVKRKKKSEERIRAINDIKTLYKSREKLIKLFDDYSRIVSEAKRKTK